MVRLLQGGLGRARQVVELLRGLRAGAGAGAALALAALALFAAIAPAANASGSHHRGGSSGGAGLSGGSSSSGSGRSANWSARSPFGNQTLRQGMSGRAVRLLQFYLNVVGYRTQVDGKFGSGTKKSVIAYQEGRRMRTTGVVTTRVGRAIGGDVQAIDQIAPNGKTAIHKDGTASAPSNAPQVVKAVVASANRIIDTSYCYGGGHGSWKSKCYDCSGSVSYALHGAALLSTPEDSTQLESYGAPGKGRWITIYADSSHVFLVVDGRAFDTANYGGPNRPAGSGPRWRWKPTGNLADGGHYIVRHPPGM